MQQPNTQLDVFYVLDFDRCLGDTDKLHKLLESVVERETELVPGRIAGARAMAERAGETFNTYKYLHQLADNRITGGTWLDLQRAFIHEAKKRDLLMPHARDLLDILEKKHLAYGIVTYGVETWQLAKLEASGLLKVPHEVTQIEEKSILLSGWKHENDNYFTIPRALCRGSGTITTRSLVLLDDKAVSFRGIPPGVRGIRLRLSEQPLLLSQQGALPPGVREVEGISGAIRALFPGESQAYN